MGKLPFELCEVAIEVRHALDEGRIVDAKRIAVQQLLAGYHSPPFLEIVAEMLAAKRRSGTKGRKRKRYPEHWIAIGHEFRDLRKAGVSHQEVCAQLAEKYKCSERTIGNTRAFFEKVPDYVYDEYLWEYRNRKNEW